MPLVGQVYRTERATLVQGDCLDVLRCLEDGEANSLVTDPPAGIGFMGKEWDSFGSKRNANCQEARDAYRAQNPNRPGYGFQGGSSLGSKDRIRFIAFLTPRLAECRRVCRPGAVGLVWALPRTSHWTALAIEEAGWVIEDRVTHMFGTGFPKSKNRLKPACEDWWLCRNPGPLWLGVDDCRISVKEGDGWDVPQPAGGTGQMYNFRNGEGRSNKRSTPHAAGRWPANVVLSHHPECVCQGTKKVKGTHRVCARGKGNKADPYPMVNHVYGKFGEHGPHDYTNDDGTETVEDWICHPDCPIRLLDEQAVNRPSGSEKRRPKEWQSVNTYGFSQSVNGASDYGRESSAGGPSRLFYCSKAGKKDRGEDNKHPTVKSTTLMSWLVKLACPEGGLVLDPFAGSGSTGVVCLRTGRRFFGVESDRESCLTAARRLLAEE
jgi:DNA modification methylase